MCRTVPHITGTSHAAFALFCTNLSAARHGMARRDTAWADVLGVMDGRGVADSGTIDDHKDAISALEDSAAAAAATAAAAAADATPVASAESAPHGHSHSHEGKKTYLSCTMFIAFFFACGHPFANR